MPTALRARPASACVVAGWTEGSRERLARCWPSTASAALEPVGDAGRAARRCAGDARRSPCCALEAGFETDDLAVIGEQDILGDRLVRPRASAQARAPTSSPRRPALAAGDLVVHVDHGIGRFVGLKTIEAAGAPHDCLEIHYAGDDRLFLPVENIELLSRYGSEDRGAARQARRRRLAGAQGAS